MELIDRLQKENKMLKEALNKKNHGTAGGTVANAVHKPTNPNHRTSNKRTNPHHLTNIDYFRRIFELAGRALAQDYRKWVDLRERVKPRARVETLGRAPADADAFAVLKHATKKPGWYAKQLHMDKKDFKVHVSQVRKMRNVKPQNCSQYHVAKAMFCAYQIARTTPRVFANLKKLKKQYERQNKIE